ncbi:calcineurin-like phosphoesterase [Colletotrichum sojae]|uniref:Calcineurin-like phosphoesterase n=1 Tax=Colletotrichum sojae TaxID=2175907 RepID=A0A8H6MQM0_9PEZI|nr:calcineurin-like phosphoesterase [Colletotrichum sojae]
MDKARQVPKGKPPQADAKHLSSTGEYVLLYRGQYALQGTNITILGCPLFSDIPAHAMTPVSNGLNDLRSIDGWTVEEQCREHQEHLRWLNDRVKSIASADPESKIVILTHYSPTVDSRAVEARHANSPLRFGFQTDLANEDCWTSRNVELWAFGHTHFNCDFTDEKSGTRVYTNQRGYDFESAAGFRRDHVLNLDW